MKLFFLICPIGFEGFLLKELEYKFSKVFPGNSVEIVNQHQGGLEIKCELAQGLLLNNILKIPTRILLRIKQQKCRDLPKLFNIIKKINWKDYLLQENINFKVSASKSRLIHTDRIESTAADAIKFYFQANRIAEKNKKENAPNQTIFIRLSDDNLEISLDTSGESLHKRSKNEYRGLASIRETYSAALLLAMLDFNNYTDITLIDPMCGSGTNLKEAHSFFKFNNRDFSYQNWKVNYDIEMIDLEDLWSFKKLLGNEIELEVSKRLVDSNIDINTGDLFDFKYNAPNIVILNPPYGKRVKITGSKQEYFSSIIDHIQKDIRPVLFGIILPQPFSKIYKPKKRISFNQNGIKVDFLIF